MFRAHLQGGRETQEACGAVNWFESEEAEEDKSSKKGEVHDSLHGNVNTDGHDFLSIYSNCALSILISLGHL